MGNRLISAIMSIAAMRICANALKTPQVAMRQIRPLSRLSAHFEPATNGGGRQYYRGTHTQQGRNSRLFLLGGAAMTAGLAYGQSKAHLSASAEGSESAGFMDTALYKPTKAIQLGKIKVSDIHTIAFTVYGNPQGKPVLFVHGGPGGGTTPAMARFFNPDKYKIVLVDQRGCGDSTPFAELEENTTWDSVADFEKVRELLQIEKWQVFGGSWGSTLSLAYAQTHPERVTELVLRGIFMLREKELKWFYQGPGASFIFPEDWARYEAAIPEEERYDFIKAYGKRLRGEMGDEEMHKAAKAWSIWEGRTSKLVQDSWESVKDKFGDDKFSLAFARIENHYFTNKGFFPRDGYLLEKERIDRIRKIPTVIVQGRYDVVCPAVTAYDLTQAMPEAQAVYTTTGHSGFEKEIISHLVAATDRFAKK
jgi:proline iminopeptidase